MDFEPIRWVVIGIGRAGRARAKAILADPACQLIGVHRGRFADELPVPQLTFEEALSQADAVAIASPTAHHAEQAEAALKADCHVVCEFPLAEDPNTARLLFDLARRRSRVLHVEHIEVLGPVASCLRQRVRGLRRVEVQFTGQGSGEESAAQLALRSLARLHRLADLSPIKAVRRAIARPGMLQVHLELQAGEAELTTQLGPQLRRSTQLNVEADNGRWEQRNQTLHHNELPVDLTPMARGLFAEDHAVAMGRIRGACEPYMEESTIVGMLEVVAEITGLARSAKTTGPA